MASVPKELLIVPEADHVDLYDQMEKIPFDKLTEFFSKNLKRFARSPSAITNFPANGSKRVQF